MNKNEMNKSISIPQPDASQSDMNLPKSSTAPGADALKIGDRFYRNAKSGKITYENPGTNRWKRPEVSSPTELADMLFDAYVPGAKDMSTKTLNDNYSLQSLLDLASELESTTTSDDIKIDEKRLAQKWNDAFKVAESREKKAADAEAAKQAKATIAANEKERKAKEAAEKKAEEDRLAKEAAEKKAAEEKAAREAAEARLKELEGQIAKDDAVIQEQVPQYLNALGSADEKARNSAEVKKREAAKERYDKAKEAWEKDPSEENGTALLAASGEYKETMLNATERLWGAAETAYGIAGKKVDPNYAANLPRGIYAAYKNGEFGDPNSKEARQVKRYLVLNSLGTTLDNMARWTGAAKRGGTAPTELAKSEWSKMQGGRLAAAEQRYNTALNTQVQERLKLILNQATDTYDITKGFIDSESEAVQKELSKLYQDMSKVNRVIAISKGMGDTWNKLSDEDKIFYMNLAVSTGELSPSEYQARLKANPEGTNAFINESMNLAIEDTKAKLAQMKASTKQIEAATKNIEATKKQIEEQVELLVSQNKIASAQADYAKTVATAEMINKWAETVGTTAGSVDEILGLFGKGHDGGFPGWILDTVRGRGVVGD